MEEKLPASWGKRFGTMLIDYVLAVVATLVLLGIVIFTMPNLVAIILGVFLTYGGGYLLYYIVFENLWQRTPGKWAMGTKVVTLDGSIPTTGQIIGRSFARLIPFEAFSLIRATPFGWHDRLSKTAVVPVAYTADDVKAIAFNKHKSNAAAIIVGAIACFAVVGVLAAIVLVSLGNAREAGADSTVKSYVNSIRIDMEMYAVGHENLYTAACLDPKITSGLMSAAKAGADDESVYGCYAQDDLWMVIVPLHTAGYYCADSTGSARSVASLPTDTELCDDLPVLTGAQ
jgi:uncharacterized RDD family membrane protein YckC